MVWLSLHNWGAVRVLNSTSERLAGGVVEVYDERFELDALAPGEMQRFFFKVRGSAPARAEVRLASGRTLCGEGRLQGVLIIDDVIGVVPEGVYLTRPSSLSAKATCGSGDFVSSSR